MAFRDVRHLTFGAVSKHDLLDLLDARDIALNDYARDLFADQDFVTSSEPQQVRIALVSLAEIGLANGGQFSEILHHASRCGLDPCPLELAPHLRLDYMDQPEGPYLTVASRELRPGPETPNGFYLRRLENQLWLRGYESGPENHYAADFSRFVFVVRD